MAQRVVYVARKMKGVAMGWERKSFTHGVDLILSIWQACFFHSLVWHCGEYGFALLSSFFPQYGMAGYMGTQWMDGEIACLCN